MFGLFDKITEFFQEIFIGIIQANLEAMFLDINENVSLVATEVGKTPSGWNAEVFSFVKNINDTVVIPIAGIIITAVLCIELINMVMEKNNMHSDTDTFDFFKYIIKMWIAVWFVSNAFTFSMAVFDVSQNLVTKAAGVINTSASLDALDVAAIDAALKLTYEGYDWDELLRDQTITPTLEIFCKRFSAISIPYCLTTWASWSRSEE